VPCAFCLRLRRPPSPPSFSSLSHHPTYRESFASSIVSFLLRFSAVKVSSLLLPFPRHHVCIAWAAGPLLESCPSQPLPAPTDRPGLGPLPSDPTAPPRDCFYCSSPIQAVRE
jgi:hypothetical protein